MPTTHAVQKKIAKLTKRRRHSRVRTASMPKSLRSIDSRASSLLSRTEPFYSACSGSQTSITDTTEIVVKQQAP